MRVRLRKFGISMVVAMYQQGQAFRVLAKQSGSWRMNIPGIERHGREGSVVIVDAGMTGNLFEPDAPVRFPVQVWIVKHQTTAQWRSLPWGKPAKKMHQWEQMQAVFPLVILIGILAVAKQRRIQSKQIKRSASSFPMNPKQVITLARDNLVSVLHLQRP